MFRTEKGSEDQPFAAGRTKTVETKRMPPIDDSLFHQF